ncbi:MAG: hypothetical protein ABR587_03385 [Candidatus Binatia bacterium]
MLIDHTTTTAATLMEDFASSFDPPGHAPSRRYLWTDAFAVCNYLALARRTAHGPHIERALRLVEGVHHELGRHRPGDLRTGWLSELGDKEGERHPTLGGLRIGKSLPERPADEASSDELEWQRDGQYFHYLTKWMHALDQVARATHRPHFNTWARELAVVAHRSFVHGLHSRGARRMHWKMSIDLSRPLVASMGRHDPLDGFLTCLQLQNTASQLGTIADGPNLRRQTADFARMIERGDLATADPLGIGGLLTHTALIAQLGDAENFDGEPLMNALLTAAQQGLAHYSKRFDSRKSATQRLAFRELGLAIGLSAVSLVAGEVQADRLRFTGSAKFANALEALRPYTALGSGILSFWLEPFHRQTNSWRHHQDINSVMLASSLVPEGVVLLPQLEERWENRTNWPAAQHR